jgi:hypothetical protein
VFSGQAPRSCVILENVLNEHGDPTVKCEDIDGSYEEWVKDLPPPLSSKGGCQLT